MLDLNEAIARLYVTFATVPKPRAIEGCPCCIANKEVDVLLAKPLWELSGDELGSYASCAFTTVGGRADYLYFLPRILELTATELGWWPELEVTARAIRSSEPTTWTAGQRAALDDFLMSLLSMALGGGGYPDLGGVICAVGRMGFDVRPYLALIAKDPAAVLSYFEQNAEYLPRNRLANAFWDRPCPAHDAVVDWFYSDEIAKVPFDAYSYVLTRPAR